MELFCNTVSFQHNADHGWGRGGLLFVGIVCSLDALLFRALVLSISEYASLVLVWRLCILMFSVIQVLMKDQMF